jgi:hypothetical protein
MGSRINSYKFAMQEIVNAIHAIREYEKLTKNESDFLYNVLEILNKAIIQEYQMHIADSVFLKFIKMAKNVKSSQAKKAVRIMIDRMESKNAMANIQQCIELAYSKLHTPKIALGDINTIKTHDSIEIKNLNSYLSITAAVFVVASYRFNCFDSEYIANIIKKDLNHEEIRIELIKMMTNSPFYEMDKVNGNNYMKFFIETFENEHLID